ncbi:MAG TPA: four helix bundle protein [Flavobacteriaceae bacterium]|nr:four helix bundle protein [Flavobacteriaceae bacterium]
MHKVEDPKVWKKSMEIVVAIYKLTESFPKEEKYGLISQIRRCAVSIPSNIAEGAGRSTKGEFKNFLSIANGSAYELFTQILLSQKLNILSKDVSDTILEQIVEIQKMNYALMKSIEKST